jgi:hypothetical protein
MELALATGKAKTRTALAGAVRQLLLLIALAYGTAYLVPACISFFCGQVNEPSALERGSRFDLHAELICESAPSLVWERSACHLPK